MMKDRAGDDQITAATGRIAPDRRWFGNTRVVSPEDLDKFRETMAEGASDPYSVVLHRKKLPLGLLRDAADASAAGKAAKSGLLASEPFDTALGVKNKKGKSSRKRVKLEQYMVPRGKNDGEDDTEAPMEEGNGESSQYTALLSAASASTCHYENVNSAAGAVLHGRDRDIKRTSGEGVDWRVEKKSDLFLKGQSKRIWGEFHKVVDSSDVVLHVIDARDVPGTRCMAVEKHIMKDCPHKHLVFVLNKVDLVPNWVAKRWLGELSAVRPTVAFHASMTHAFGKGALISLLRQFSKLMQDKKQISVGIVGYPNVGKSSVINTLIGKKSCKVAPIPGETKIWQYVTLMKRMYLIDCPGVVVDTSASVASADREDFKDFHGDASEVASVLRGVVRPERLENPEDYIPFVLQRVERQHVAACYGIPKAGEDTWRDTEHLLEIIAVKGGRLYKGGEPCLRESAIVMIRDYQRGKLPHFVAPPDLTTIDDGSEMKQTDILPKGVQMKGQDMDKIGLDSGLDQEIEVEEEEDGEEDVIMKDRSKSGLASGKKRTHEGEDADSDAENEDKDDDKEKEQDIDEEDSEDDDDLPPVIVVGGDDWDETM